MRNPAEEGSVRGYSSDMTGEEMVVRLQCFPAAAKTMPQPACASFPLSDSLQRLCQ